MSESNIIAAEARDRAGKGTARAVRREGQVPAVIYGNKEEPTLISVKQRDLLKELHAGNFTSKLYDIELGGKKIRVLPRDVQLDPVTDRPIHADFLRIVGSSRLRLMIPVHFIDHGASAGLKKGGVLNVVRHEIEFFCRADSIPEEITVSLANTEIGDSIHISSVKLPDGVKPVIANRDFTVATIAPPTTDAEPAAATAAAEAAPAAAAKAPAAGGAAKAPAAAAKAPAAKAPAAKAPAAKK